MKSTIPELPTQYCLYARKSSESDEKQALSIDSQIKEMLQVAERDGLFIKEVRRESHSAKASGQRPVYNELIEDIRKGTFNGIMTWAPDRLSRNAGDLGALVDLMDQKLLHEIRTYGQKFTNSPNEKFLLMILGSQAKLENDNRGLNVKRGLRTKVEMGLWPGVAPMGYFNEKNRDRKCHLVIDPARAPIVRKIFERTAYEGMNGRQIYTWLKDDLDFKSRNGKYFSLSNIYLLLRNSFYYGTFEYPRGSGNWHKGIHQPIITKELFEKVQERLLDYNTGKSHVKEFAFTRLMKCGSCGSGITADEKFKKRTDGTVTRYVYYGCTRGKDLKCKEGYISEQELIKQFEDLVDELKLDQLGLKDKINQEITRYASFRKNVLQLENETNQNEIDGKIYAKYILRNGEIFEKRDLLSNLKDTIFLTKKRLDIKNSTNFLS